MGNAMITGQTGDSGGGKRTLVRTATWTGTTNFASPFTGAVSDLIMKPDDPPGIYSFHVTLSSKVTQWGSGGYSGAKLACHFSDLNSPTIATNAMGNVVIPAFELININFPVGQINSIDRDRLNSPDIDEAATLWGISKKRINQYARVYCSVSSGTAVLKTDVTATVKVYRLSI